ncbi:MAG: hypothetical protein AB8G96_12430 [Phycisphaerales bacterium]
MSDRSRSFRRLPVVRAAAAARLATAATALLFAAPVAVAHDGPHDHRAHDAHGHGSAHAHGHGGTASIASAPASASGAGAGLHGPEAPAVPADGATAQDAAASVAAANAPAFTFDDDWCKLPSDRPLGNTHGGIVIDAAGHVYYNTDTDRAIMVHTADGEFVRAIAPELPAIHAMQMRLESPTEGPAEEFIYAAHLRGKQVVKLRLDGSIVWTIGLPVESGFYPDGAGGYNPTGIAVAPNGDVYIADGYGRQWIHHYRADRTYVRSFGGPGSAPGQFSTCHGLAIDVRGEDPMLLVCDRENRRIQRFHLDGRFDRVVATDLRRPCGLSIHGDHVAVAELEGRVTILGEDFAPVAYLGDNPDRGQWANNGVGPTLWEPDTFTAPHGVCFDADGNLYVQDWNATGRVRKLIRRRGDG